MTLRLHHPPWAMSRVIEITGTGFLLRDRAPVGAGGAL